MWNTHNGQRLLPDLTMQSTSGQSAGLFHKITFLYWSLCCLHVSSYKKDIIILTIYFVFVMFLIPLLPHISLLLILKILFFIDMYVVRSLWIIKPLQDNRIFLRVHLFFDKFLLDFIFLQRSSLFFTCHSYSFLFSISDRSRWHWNS